MELHTECVPIFKALADETRLEIVQMLSCGEMCACDILESFHITQPTLSYHMKILTECGLIDGRREGAWMKYSINTSKLSIIIAFCDCVTTEQKTCICKNFRRDVKCDSL